MEMRGKTDLSIYKKTLDTKASKLKMILWYFTNIFIFLNPLFLSVSLKRWILKLFGAKIGKKVIIKPRVNIKFPWKLEIGDYSWIGEDVWIDNLDFVTIGKNCCISQGALLLCGNHNFTSESFDLITKAIIIDEGVWIGAKSIVCPGVHCKSHSVLAVNSVSTKNMDEYSIYQGNPAIKVKDRIISVSKKTYFFEQF